MDFDLFNDDHPRELPLPDGELWLFPRMELDRTPGELLRELIDTTPWEEREITLWGKTYLQPRLMAWYGDAGARYSYSGTTLEPMPWTPILEAIRTRVEALAEHRFNSVLLNYYRNGSDSMGMHSDDEPELGPDPVIASLSLGVERRFVLKHRQRKDLDTVRIPLPSGSLLVMRGTTQRFWKHGIPKERTVSGPRVNLTFRSIVHPRA